MQHSPLALIAGLRNLLEFRLSSLRLLLALFQVFLELLQFLRQGSQLVFGLRERTILSSPSLSIEISNREEYPHCAKLSP